MPEPLFAGKRLSRRERKEAHRRSRERALARAEALAPSPGPPTASAQPPSPAAGEVFRAGPPLGAPRPAAPAPSRPPATEVTAPHAWPVAPWAPQAAQWPAAAPSAMARALPGPAFSDDTPARGRGALGHGIDVLEGSARRGGSRLRGPWGAKASTTGVAAGLLIAVVSLCTGLAIGAPVLGHDGQPVAALAGLAGLGAGALWAGKGWSKAARKTRVTVAATALLLGASFTVGTLTNPVVVDGHVFLSTSVEARSYRLLQEMRTDLLALAEADTYLTYDAAQAGAHYTEYAGQLDTLELLSAKYARMAGDPGVLPDPLFAEVVNQTTASAYWAARAMESKIEVVKADNAKSQADLATHRASYATAVIASGDLLRLLSIELDLPLTQMGPTE